VLNFPAVTCELNNMRLLPLERFAHVFEPLQGKRIGFVKPLGNVGDELIALATFQLLHAFGIRWKVLDAQGQADCDEVLFGGGGNMGTLYRNNWEIRRQILGWGIPVTILPQSFTSREDRPYHRVYVREWRSQAYCPEAILAPDLALGLDYDTPDQPRRRLGMFLRRDQEGAVQRPWLTRDPAKICRTPAEYLELAARYERIVTDRLHFAICGLILRRDTTLLPSSYHKNQGMYETWLKDLGCNFANSLAEVRLDQEVRLNRAA
jgi:exopolysaccharide biosynthesis predicted pyruvyltransferase EpsI